jgi:hypothetical protein
MTTKNPVLTTAIGTLGYTYTERADDKAPEGASWKPDGKFKTHLIVDDASALENIQDEARSLLFARFPDAKDVDPDTLVLPVRPGEALGGKKAEKLAGKTVIEAKSDFRPAIYDAKGKQVPKGVFAYSGDVGRLKVSLYPWSKEETVKERVNGKVVEKKEKVYGVALRLAAIQIVEKRGGGDGGFDEVDGGYEASEADVRPGRSASDDETAGETPKRRPVTNGADF